VLSTRNEAPGSRRHTNDPSTASIASGDTSVASAARQATIPSGRTITAPVTEIP
jgi:hypothetical protein